MNIQIAYVSRNEDVWYVDLGASNHMTSQGEWFREMGYMDMPSYMETCDDPAHPFL